MNWLMVDEMMRHWEDVGKEEEELEGRIFFSKSGKGAQCTRIGRGAHTNEPEGDRQGEE